MSETKFRDRDTNTIVSMDADQAARVAGVKSRGGVARFVPVEGSSEVAVTDNQGQTRITQMDPDALSSALQRNNSAITPLGETNRPAIEELANKQAEEAAWRGLAGDQAAETFIGNLIPGGRALNRTEMTPEDAAQDAMMARLQDEENPLAAGLGTGAQLLGTSLAPVGALGKAAGLYKGAKSVKAMSLMGFADEGGQLLAKGLAGAGVPQVASKVAGRVAAGAMVNIPLSIQFQAAQAVDYDRPLSYEAFSRNLGTHVLLGAAFDLAIPAAGAAVRGLAKGAQKLSPMRALSNLADLAAARAIIKNPQMNPLVKAKVLLNTHRNVVGRNAQKNTARRLVKSDVLDEAADASARYARAGDEIFPNKLKINASGSPQVASLKRMEQSLDELAASNPAIAGMPQYAQLRPNVANLAGMPKAVNTMVAKADYAADTLTTYLRTPNLPTALKVTGKGKGIEFTKVANDIREELTAAGMPSRLADELDGVIGATQFDKDTVRRAFEFRNRQVINGLNGDAATAVQAEVVKTHLDGALRSIGGQMDEALKATDVVLDAVKGIRGAGPRMRDIGQHTTAEGFGAGAMDGFLLAARDASELLQSRGVLLGKDARFAGAHIEGGRTLVGKLAGRFEDAAAMNAIRGKAADGFEAIVHTPLAAGEATSTFAKFEAAAQYLQDSGEVISNGIGKLIGTSQTHGVATSPVMYGVFQYRNMETMEQKKEAYDTIRDNVNRLTATDDTLIDGVSKISNGLQADPELANNISGQAVQAAQYLKRHMPPPPQGIIPTRAPSASPAEMTKILEIAGALDDPVSVMDATLKGSLRAPGLAAVSEVYPNMLSDMRVQLSEHLMKDPATYGQIAYRVRLDIDTFLGGGFEPSAQPQALVNLQNRAAQTEGQEQSLRGGAMRAPQPGDNSASDRLAAF